MKTAKKLFLAGLLAISIIGVFFAALPQEAAGQTRYMYCTSNADCGPTGFTGAPTCQGGDVWQTYTSNTCINPGSAQSYCVTSNVSRYQATCTGGQFCSAGRCVSPYVPPQQTCLNHSYKQCSGNKLYWYNSCRAKQDVAQDCAAEGLVCKNGASACIKAEAGTGSTGSPTAGQPTNHYMTKCHNGDIVWFDAQGNPNDTFRSCDDQNSCTIDSCENAQCSNSLQCDGSTCAKNSDDYKKYCEGQSSNGTAAISGASIRDFVKRWYGWIILIAILIILFIVIFRRLSTKA